MKELYKRVLSSVVLFPIVFFLIVKGSYFFLMLLLISFFIGMYEWQKMSKGKSYNILGFIFIICSFNAMYQMRMSEEVQLLFFRYVLLVF